RANSAAGIATSGACREIPARRDRAILKRGVRVKMARRVRARLTRGFRARRARRIDDGYFESFRISRAAFAPEPPVSPVPGCVPEPHRYSPWTGVRYRAQSSSGRMVKI